MSHAFDPELIARLKERVSKGVSDLFSIAEELKEKERSIEQLLQDTRWYMKALEAESRHSPEPYKPQELPSVHLTVEFPQGHQLITVEVADGAKADDAFELIPHTASLPTGKKKGKALDISYDSPTGVVRKILIEAGGEPRTINQILAAVPSSLPFEVTREFLYRTFPRMVKRGEIAQVGKGEYRYVMK